MDERFQSIDFGSAIAKLFADEIVLREMTQYLSSKSNSVELLRELTSYLLRKQEQIAALVGIMQQADVPIEEVISGVGMSLGLEVSELMAEDASAARDFEAVHVIAAFEGMQGVQYNLVKLLAEREKVQI